MGMPTLRIVSLPSIDYYPNRSTVANILPVAEHRGLPRAIAHGGPESLERVGERRVRTQIGQNADVVSVVDRLEKTGWLLVAKQAAGSVRECQRSPLAGDDVRRRVRKHRNNFV